MFGNNNVNTTYTIYSDWDLARLFESLPMQPTDKQTFVADYSALKQNQIDTRGSIRNILGRLDTLDAQVVVINRRLDDVEAVAYMGLIT